MQHAHFSGGSQIGTASIGMPDCDGAYQNLVKAEARLRDVVEKVNGRLNSVLPPSAAGSPCSPPQAACVQRIRTPLSQMVHEINLVIDRLDDIVCRVDL